jgi:hypothetical protein
MAVTVVIFSDHRAARHLQRGEQAGGAVADVVMGHPGWGVGMMAKIGAVWPTPESGFSSTHNTSAPAGGSRYKPTMSRILSPFTG